VTDAPAIAAAPHRPALREVFASREFRGLWAALALSAAGDRLALVALSLLVYDRTRSPFLAAIAWAAGTLPYMTGLVFAALPDRVPRRTVMIGADLARAALTVVMALPGVPLPAMIALMYLVGAAQPPFDAARSAAVRDVLDVGLYALAATVMQVTWRLMIVCGAAGGGLAVALTGPRPALAADAATFTVSALLIRLAVRRRPASQPAVPPGSGSPEGRDPGHRRRGRDEHGRRRRPGGTASGVRLVFGDPRLRTVMLLGWLAVFYEVPEGIAAPYAAAVGGGAAATGLLIASSQAMVTVAPVYARFPESVRQRWMGPMAVATTGTLILTALRPGIAGSMAILAAVGVFGTYQVTANTAFVAAVPASRRGLAFSVAATGLVAGQGVAFAAAGAAARYVAPSMVTAAAGALGAVAACVLALYWRRLPAAR
jgi:MFS family permease